MEGAKKSAKVCGLRLCEVHIKKGKEKDAVREVNFMLWQHPFVNDGFRGAVTVHSKPLTGWPDCDLRSPRRKGYSRLRWQRLLAPQCGR